MVNCILQFLKNYLSPDLYGQVLGHRPAKRKVTSSIPDQAHAWVAGLVPVRVCVRGNQWMFLSLSFSLPSLICKNK